MSTTTTATTKRRSCPLASFPCNFRIAKYKTTSMLAVLHTAGAQMAMYTRISIYMCVSSRASALKYNNENATKIRMTTATNENYRAQYIEIKIMIANWIENFSMLSLSPVYIYISLSLSCVCVHCLPSLFARQSQDQCIV